MLHCAGLVCLTAFPGGLVIAKWFIGYASVVSCSIAMVLHHDNVYYLLVYGFTDLAYALILTLYCRYGFEVFHYR